MEKVAMEGANMMKQGNYHSRPICLLTTIYVTNALNSARLIGRDILKALKGTFNIPEYSYLS